MAKQSSNNNQSSFPQNGSGSTSRRNMYIERQQNESSFTIHTLRIVTVLSIVNFSEFGSATINPVLDLNGTFPYLINKTSGQIIEPRYYMNFDNLYTPNNEYWRHETAQRRNYYMMKAFDFANYYQSDYWHYSSQTDLKLSAFPVANKLKCSEHLDWLEHQLNYSSRNLFMPGEQHNNLMTLVDSFGRPESATFLGHGYWLGSHYECTRIKIDLSMYDYESHCYTTNNGYSSPECRQDQEKYSPNSLQASSKDSSGSSAQQDLSFRYCIGKAHDSDWPTNDDYIPRISYKVGLCLPETCETLSFETHRLQIERLMRFNLPDYLKNRTNLHEMYCLPDERSPIRQFSTSARIFMAIIISWLLLLVAATTIYSCYKRYQEELVIVLSAQHMHENDSRVDFTHSQVVAKSIDNSHNNMTQHITTATKTNSIRDPHPLNDLQDSRKQLTLEQSNKTSEELTCDQQYHLGCIPCNQQNGYQHNHNSSPEKALLNDPKLLNQLIKPLVTPHANGMQENNHASTGIFDHRPHKQTIDIDSQSSVSYHTTASSSALSAWIADSPTTIRILQALSIMETLREFQVPPEMLREPGSSRRLRVNLNALDSIKCLCCVLVIFGHIIFIHMQHLSNIIHTIELSYDIAPRILIAFFNFVDTFFIISGMLTSYFIFKRFNKKTFSNPLLWINISFLRLLRLSPVYLLVFWFAKTITVYISYGPIWDYGTDNKSIKGLCINDHWWKSLLYIGNWGTMQPLCILPAWSIIVDSQYSLVMPPVLYLIFKHKRLGFIALLLGCIISTAKMSLQLATQTAVKPNDMAKVRLHVYPLISRFAAEFYNTAWNRIGPVAIGIIGGHALYLYDIGKIRRWPNFMRGPMFKFILAMHVLIFLLPAIGRFTDDPKSVQDTDMTIFIMSNATIKPIWSLINTIFLLRLITDLRKHSIVARLMSHNIWHCLGKLCFASYLIHYEVILILLKSRQEGLVDPNWSNALREFSLAFLISTLISYLIYILFEAPVNKLISMAIMKQTKHRPTKENFREDDEQMVERQS